jgi:transcriptional regulator with XRE-family HTH domain
MMQAGDQEAVPSSARQLFGSELRRMRQALGLSQDQLAGLVLHSRTLIATVELGKRWPPHDLAVRCDDVMHGDGALTRLWPLVNRERLDARRVLTDARLSSLHELVLRLAMLTGTDLSVLSVADPDAKALDSGEATQR